jgi:hypothetical protein
MIALLLCAMIDHCTIIVHIRIIEVWDITMKMLGIGKRGTKSGHPTFSAKAAETAGILPFIVELIESALPKFAALGGDHHLKAQLLLESGRALLAFEETLLQYGRIIPRAGQLEALSKFQAHAYLFERAGGSLKPKHHIIGHMLRSMSHLGNARFFMTYKDESANRTIARIAASCHRLTFYSVAHIKCSYVKFL